MGGQGGGLFMKKPIVDKNKCIGCGMCTFTATQTFILGDDGKSSVINPQGDTEELIQKAIDECPVQAISWTEE